jgi:hypothetical protein
MTRIKAGGTSASGAAQAVGMGVSLSAGKVAQQVMGDLAGKMAGSIGDALGLIGISGADQWKGNSNDPYDIEDIVEELASGIGGNASEAGELSRALHAFVQESAALFAARPESRSLAFLQTVINEGSDSGSDVIASLSAVSQHVDAATILLRGVIR